MALPLQPALPHKVGELLRGEHHEQQQAEADDRVGVLAVVFACARGSERASGRRAGALSAQGIVVC